MKARKASQPDINMSKLGRKKREGEEEEEEEKKEGKL